MVFLDVGKPSCEEANARGMSSMAGFMSNMATGPVDALELSCISWLKGRQN